MKVRKFVAADTRTALKQVRDALGDDAIILSNKPVQNGIEIIAAKDFQDALLAESTKATEEKRTKSTEKENKSISPVSNDFQNDSIIEVESSSERTLREMRGEITTLKGLLQEQMSGLVWGKMKNQNPMQATLFRFMIQCGFSNWVAQRVLKNIDPELPVELALKKLKELLSNSIQVIKGNITEPHGFHVLVGPSGVGKTQVIAKLAARYALHADNESIAILTTDTKRIGAFEQLKIYGKILNIPVTLVDGAENLAQLLHENRLKKLVLVDTAGYNPKDPKLEQELEIFDEVGLSFHVSLVLSANLQYSYLKQSLKSYQRFGIQECIVTKVDETESLGEIISLLIESQLGVRYFTDGPHIPDDIRELRSGMQLVSRALSLSNVAKNPVSDDVLARLLAEVDLHE